MSPPDPWLPARLRAEARFRRGETAVHAGLILAMTVWLDTACALVLSKPIPKEARRLLAGPVRTVVASGAPDIDAAGDALQVWGRAIQAHVEPALEQAFGEAFLDAARRADISPLPFQLEYLEQVHDRLRDWPEGAFEELRPELLEMLSEGMDYDQVTERVGRILNIDAPSRRIRAEISAVDRELAQPGLTRAEKQVLRARRRELWEQHDESLLEWQWRARRIARTEIHGATEGGAYAAALAVEEAGGQARFKRWLATGDHRVRASHVVADGQIVPIRERFRVGDGELLHPGEAGAPAHLVIQCRCTALYVTRAEVDADLASDRAGYGVAPGAARLGPDDPDDVAAAMQRWEDGHRGLDGLERQLPEPVAVEDEPAVEVGEPVLPVDEPEPEVVDEPEDDGVSVDELDEWEPEDEDGELDEDELDDEEPEPDEELIEDEPEDDEEPVEEDEGPADEDDDLDEPEPEEDPEDEELEPDADEPEEIEPDDEPDDPDLPPPPDHVPAEHGIDGDRDAVPNPAAPVGTAENPRHFPLPAIGGSWDSARAYCTPWNENDPAALAALDPVALGAIGYYTANGFGEINGTLRDSEGRESAPDEGEDLDAFFASDGVSGPTEWVILTRGTGVEMLNLVPGQDPHSAVGKTITAYGYTSTSIGDVAAFSGTLRMIFRAPPGTKALYMDGVPGQDRYNRLTSMPDEREVLLAKGTRFQVLSVEMRDDQRMWKYDVVAEIVGQGV